MEPTQLVAAVFRKFPDSPSLAAKTPLENSAGMQPPSSDPTSTDSISPTGIQGLDHILRGGLPAHRVYLVRGAPGVGKTTLALQYLLTGAENGERGLYITLSETREEVEAVARSHGWRLDGISVFELSALEEGLKQEAQNTVFYPSELELNKTTQALLAKIEEVKPRRIALDSLSELRLLAESALRYRRQLLALKQYFNGQRVTVLLLDDHDEGDSQVQSIVHGVICLEQLATDYGAERRRLKINKLRGVNFVGGYHDAMILPGGLQIYPRLIAAEHHHVYDQTPLKTGNAGMDALLGGGLDRGSSCLLLGPAGAGKSSIAMMFAIAAAEAGQRVDYYLFEESLRMLLKRAGSLDLPFKHFIEEGRIVVRQIRPAELAPGQFVNIVQENVQKNAGRMVVIDSLNGYLQAMPDVKYLSVQLHELQAFLAHYGIVTLMTVAQHGLLGQMQSPIDITYLADSVLLLRFFEQDGAIRKAIAMVKNRGGQHETTIREYKFGKKGIVVGEPLREFRGVLTGVPSYAGGAEKMLPKG